ncbi:MAG: hypothetical protein MOGMAGMI_02317 [Candidatus Omnitrophica bacterium]|nr:hypothetical protein [Candidatus Omnitrophota bacterium]
MKGRTFIEEVVTRVFPKTIARMMVRSHDAGFAQGVTKGHERTRENAARYAEKCALNYPPALCKHLAENLRRLKHPDEVKGGAV